MSSEEMATQLILKKSVSHTGVTYYAEHEQRLRSCLSGLISNCGPLQFISPLTFLSLFSYHCLLTVSHFKQLFVTILCMINAVIKIYLWFSWFTALVALFGSINLSFVFVLYAFPHT